MRFSHRLRFRTNRLRTSSQAPYGPAIEEPQVAPGGAEIVGEIRVHGNASLDDDDVLKLAGIAVGDTIAAVAWKTSSRG